MNTTALTTTNGVSGLANYSADWSRQQEKLDLLKRTVAEGTSNDEFALFVEVARSTGLNPFQRQIYAIMRETYNRDTKRKEPRMTIQTGIDGYRLIAARTGLHAGTSDADYGPVDKDGYPEWARVTVKKLIPGGHIAEFPATARWAEYVQLKDEYVNNSKTGRQVPSGQWPKMPYLMLGKVAEALALRKAFPADLSGIYTAEEMSQADSQHTPDARPITTATAEPSPPRDELAIARKGLFAELSKAAKKLSLSKTESEACLKALLLSTYGSESTSERTPDDLKSLTDTIKTTPSVLIPDWPAVIEAEVVNEGDIPPFDPEAPFVGATT